jgi:hypothetical protein
MGYTLYMYCFSEWKWSCAGFCYELFISVLPLKILFSRCVGWKPINLYYPSRYFLNYLVFQPFGIERTWWWLFQKRVVGTKFYIYLFIMLTIPPISTKRTITSNHCTRWWSQQILSGNEVALVFAMNCLYLYCRWRSYFQDVWVGSPLTYITPPLLCACSKPWYLFSSVSVVIIIVCNG